MYIKILSYIKIISYPARCKTLPPASQKPSSGPNPKPNSIQSLAGPNTRGLTWSLANLPV